MTQLLTVTCLWLHSLATVIFIGHFILLALIYLPALDGASQEARGVTLSAISRRSRSWLYASLVVFAVTGSYLTLTDPSYLGLGNFSNPWAMLMLVKHTLILGMIGVGFWFNAILRIGPLASSNTGAVQAFARFRSYAYAMAVLGAAVLLLTAISQAQ